MGALENANVVKALNQAVDRLLTLLKPRLEDSFSFMKHSNRIYEEQQNKVAQLPDSRSGRNPVDSFEHFRSV